MRRPVRRGTASLWSAVIALVLVGVSAALARAVFLSDLVTRADPARQMVLDALSLEDPHSAHRPDELKRFDAQFAAAPLPTLLHVLPGALFLLLAPLQFSPRVRNRHIRFHRWSGRLLVLTGLVGAVTGFYFGLFTPYGGLGESTAIALFGGVFVFALARAYFAIRVGDVVTHRAWMIRAFAIALGISTVRLVGAAFDLALTPLGVTPAGVFVLSLWVGWGATLAAGELWIRRTRPAAIPIGSPVRTR